MDHRARASQGAAEMTRIVIASAFVTLLAASAVTVAAQQPPATAGQKPTAPPATPPPAAPKPALPFPADAKIGFVNLQRVINDSKFGQAGQAQLKTLTDKRSGEVTALQKQIQTLQTELQTQTSVLSQAVQQQKATELDGLQRRLEFERQQASADVQSLQERLLNDFTEKVMPIAEAMRKEKGLWIIMAVGQESNTIALDEALDLSPELIKRLDGVK
jgi:outer membrane protein